jgi:hypothetical protein
MKFIVRSLSVVSVVLAIALPGCVAGDEDPAPAPSEEEIQAHLAASGAEFLAANTYDGIFHVPRPPSVQDEISYSGCSHTWTSVWWYGPIPMGTQWHVSNCDGNTGEYCTWIEVWLGAALDPTGNVGSTKPACTPTACTCVEDPPGGGDGGDCGCSGWCGNSCCI